MTWFLYSILAALFYSGMLLSSRRLTDLGFSSKQVLLFLCGFVFLGFAVLNLFSPGGIWHSQDLSFFLKIIFLAGIFASIGNWANFEGIRRSPNPGYAAAVAGTSALPILFLSIPLFKSEFSPIKLLGSIIIISGIFLLVRNRGERTEGKGRRKWYYFSFIAILAFTFAVLAVKRATLIPEVSPKEIILLTFGINFLFFIFFNRKELKGYFTDRPGLKAFLPFVSLAAAFSFFGNYFGVSALTLAPNPGYYGIIKDVRILFITLISLKLFSLKLDRAKLAGVILIFLGLLAFAF